MVEPSARRVPGHSVGLQLYEWPGAGPAVLLVHATGFHARCWDRVVAHLPGRHVFAVDMRGHGRSDKPAPPYLWRNFGLDLVAAVDALGLRGAIGVGHSKGGHAVVQAAAERPGAFAGLVLADPVIMPPEAYAAWGERPPIEHFAAKRRNQWASPEEMFERFRSRPPFTIWEEGALRDYCEHGLLPNPKGEGLVLACPPEIEAAVYAGSGGTDIGAAIASIDVPVRVLRATPRVDREGPMDMSSSPTDPGLAARFLHGEDVPLPHLSHFMPMQAPALIASHIREMAERVSGRGH